MKVQVAVPEVEGETVRFRWTQSAPNPFQHADTFFFRYEGLELAAFSPLLLYEVFLGLQLKVFAAYKKPVEVVFPEALPRSTVEFWRAFHDADRVTIGPVSETVAYEPWRTPPAVRADARPFGVFFGGGKDTTLTTCLLSELYGRENVLLIQYVGPLRGWPALWDRLERRQERLMLRPARERLGVATQRIWTDYQAQFDRPGYHARPHVELYTAGALPVLLAGGVTLVSFGYPWTEYPIFRLPDGQIQFRFSKSRPEMLATQSRHYRRAFGADVTVTDLSLPFSGIVALRLLVERYPSTLEQIVPCTLGGVDERWCLRCGKCCGYALLGLAVGFVDPEFDYDAVFARSPYVKRLVRYAESGVERTVLGNAPWDPRLVSPTGYVTLCHAIASLSIDTVADRLSPEAFANLLTVQALFGNRRFPSIDLLPAKTIDRLDNETARRVARIAAEHAEIVDDLPGPHLVGNKAAECDFGPIMPTRTEQLDHLRDDLDTRATTLLAEEWR